MVETEEKITAGITAHNEEETIGKVLDQILSASIPLKEVIAVVAGQDNTADIVRSKMEEDNRISLVKEDGREGQIEAQNKILSGCSSEFLLMVDGDGYVESGSIEALWSETDENCIVAGREKPVTGEGFTSRIIEAHGKLHHNICRKDPRYASHLGIIPADLLERFPSEIILDDAYIENLASERGMELKYVEEAVKHHNVPESPKFFYRQQRKNWAGRIQARKRGYSFAKKEGVVTSVFLRQLFRSDIEQKFYLLVLAFIESIAYLDAWRTELVGDSPLKWYRPS